MPHFFISYAKKDTRELALQLEATLNTLPNVTAWVDKSLRAGHSWEIQIQTEIDRCDYMIVLYSPDINRHKHGEAESYVLTEISYAKYTVHKPIIPVMAQKTEAPMSLTMAHYIDFTISGLRLNDLITAICDEADINILSAVVTKSYKEDRKSVVVENAPVHVTDATFEAEVINYDKPVLVDFWAEWCEPCRQVALTLEKLSMEYAGQIRIARVDADSNTGLSQAFRVMSIPTTMLVKEKTIVFSQPGALPESAFRDLIKQLIALDMSKVKT